jgi:hypothetical protein
MERIFMTQYCSYCSTDFMSVSKHCDSQEHKDNVRIDNQSRNPVKRLSVEDFRKHYEAMSETTQENIKAYDINDSFWEVAKQALNEEDYQLLKEGLIGRNKNIKSTRNIRFGRFSRAVQGV